MENGVMGAEPANTMREIFIPEFGTVSAKYFDPVKSYRGKLYRLSKETIRQITEIAGFSANFEMAGMKTANLDLCKTEGTVLLLTDRQAQSSEFVVRFMRHVWTEVSPGGVDEGNVTRNVYAAQSLPSRILNAVGEQLRLSVSDVQNYFIRVNLKDRTCGIVAEEESADALPIGSYNAFTIPAAEGDLPARVLDCDSLADDDKVASAVASSSASLPFDASGTIANLSNDASAAGFDGGAVSLNVISSSRGGGSQPTDDNLVSGSESHSALRLASDSTSHLASDSTSHLVSDSTSHLASDSTSHLASDSASHLASDSASHLASHSASHLASDSASHSVSKLVSHSVSDSVSHSVSQLQGSPAEHTRLSPDAVAGGRVVVDALGSAKSVLNDSQQSGHSAVEQNSDGPSTAALQAERPLAPAARPPGTSNEGNMPHSPFARAKAGVLLQSNGSDNQSKSETTLPATTLPDPETRTEMSGSSLPASQHLLVEPAPQSGAEIWDGRVRPPARSARIAQILSASQRGGQDLAEQNKLLLELLDGQEERVNENLTQQLQEAHARMLESLLESTRKEMEQMRRDVNRELESQRAQLTKTMMPVTKYLDEGTASKKEKMQVKDTPDLPTQASDAGARNLILLNTALLIGAVASILWVIFPQTSSLDAIRRQVEELARSTATSSKPDSAPVTTPVAQPAASTPATKTDAPPEAPH